jgi:DNA-binding response OmpR family regulator
MRKIFIFDTYPPVRQLLAEELAAEGNVTMDIGSRELVSELVGRFEPDLIILDLFNRGRMDWDLMAELRARYPSIPVLLFTTFHPQEMPRLKEADAWVKKSFHFEDLKQKIASLLGKGRGGPEIQRPVLARDSNQVNLGGARSAGSPLGSH